MKREDIAKFVLESLSEFGDLKEDTPLVKTTMDSLDMLYFIMECEDEYGIIVNDVDAAEFNSTPKQIIDRIELLCKQLNPTTSQPKSVGSPVTELGL